MVGFYVVISGVVRLCLAVYQCCHIQCGSVMICVYLFVTIWLCDQLSYQVRLVYEVLR